MATDGPTPPPCDPEIFQHGQPVAALDGSSNAVERWVKAVALLATARVDWHYSGGRAQVLYLGDAEGLDRVIKTMQQIEQTLDGSVLQYFEPGDPGLYRQGVTETPPDTLGAFYDGGRGSVYIVRSDED